MHHTTLLRQFSNLPHSNKFRFSSMYKQWDQYHVLNQAALVLNKSQIILIVAVYTLANAHNQVFMHLQCLHIYFNSNNLTIILMVWIQDKKLNMECILWIHYKTQNLLLPTRQLLLKVCKNSIQRAHFLQIAVFLFWQALLRIQQTEKVLIIIRMT